MDETVEPDTLLRLRDWADGNDVPVLVYLVTNPFSEQARQLFECDVPVWGWNSDLLHALYPGPAKVEDPKPNNPFSPADEWLYNLSGNQRFVVAPVEEGRIVSVLEETRERYRQFLHSARREKDQGLLRVASRLLSAIYALEELPVPAALYDREAVHVWGVIPVGRRLMALEKARSSIERSYPTAASFLGVTMQLLHSLHDMVESSGSGKPAVLLAAIDEAIRQGASTAVLVRNRAARRAVESFLRDHGKRGSYLLDHDVYIVTPRELSLIDQVSTLLFTSAPRFRQRHLLRYPRTRNLAFLAYPSEVPTISYLLKYELRKLESMLNFDAQVSTISSITGLRRSKVRSLTVRPESEDSSAPEIVFTTPQGATVQETELEPIFPDFLTQEQGELESAEEGEGPESEDPELEESGEPVEALIIRLESGKTLLTKKSRYVSRYLEPTNAVDNISASRLRAGDLLVLVDESVKKSLTQIAIERVDRHPAMVEVISYQRSWVDVLCDGMERKGDTSTTLLRKLQRKGSSIQTPVAIHLWRLGVIIGPRDKQDLKRIGEIYEDDFLVDKVERIYRAVERLRSIHRKLAQRLRHLIPRAGVGWKNLGDEDLVIDRDLNLYLEDFADAVRIDRVIQLDGPVEIDPSLLNRTFEGESWKE
ncbi:MAG: DrmE family protein [bacterium]